MSDAAPSDWPRWRPQWPQSEQPQHLVEALLRVEEWERRGKADVGSVLRDVNNASLRFVAGAECAGITTVDASGIIATVGATDDYPSQLDDVQRETAEGPCLSASRDQGVLHIQDLGTDPRWPRFCHAAIGRTPIRSVLSCRLFLDDDNHGAALNFMARSPAVFTDDSIELALLSATHTTAVWNLLHAKKQVCTGLSSGDLIGQAKGILMERFGIDAVAAFELLKRLSQQSNSRLSEVAVKLIDAEPRPRHKA